MLLLLCSAEGEGCQAGPRFSPPYESVPRFRRKIKMIRFLANIFRGLSFIIGITAPPPEEDQRPFVFMWLGVTVFVLAFCAVLFYALSRVHLP